MKSFRNLLVFSFAIVAFLLAGSAAKADTVLTLTDPYQSSQGQLFTFDATVTNTGTSTVYLSGDLFSGDFPPLTSDDSAFNSFPLSLDPGESYTGELFTITAPAYTLGSDNFYSGTISILGGADGSAQDTIASANFNVQVTPEPSSFLLFGTGLLVLGSVAGRKLLA